MVQGGIKVSRKFSSLALFTACVKRSTKVCSSPLVGLTSDKSSMKHEAACHMCARAMWVT